MQAYQEKLSPWGRWFDGFLTSSEEVIDSCDIAEVNLRCSALQPHGFLRPRTRRELFADFADLRARCLQEQFRFSEALEANFLATRLAPQIQQLSVSHAITDFTYQLFKRLGAEPGPSMIYRVANFENDPKARLEGPDADLFKKLTTENLTRILRNRYPSAVQIPHDKVFANVFNLL